MGLLNKTQNCPLNQQSQAKGGTTQDLSFLKEASPIYVTSLSNNTVSVTNTSTTVTAGTKTNYSTGSSSQQVATNNNNTTKPIGNVPTTATTTATNPVAGSAAIKSAQNVINFNAGAKPNTNQIQSTAPQSSNTSLYSNVPPSTSRQQNNISSLATLSEGELELQEESSYETNSNISRGGTEVLLGDQSLRQENRSMQNEDMAEE
ncbi:AAEL014013-PA [Aedes aegypti]|uniref:AAEL014013-PA n=1 Tax=Aedes aegypti TaxID=7159 RepID=Q16HI5_AEDAE|nr:AAEL014013-PA [Aedes aegypti]